ncbi:MAG TPA: site-2 protease family protein [Pyrinomonadaceae bacterium]|nr:site-2 protease family protein [Pyrinomonadaceae bacterium]
MAESIRTVPPGFDFVEHRTPKISARDWRIHGALFILTVLTTTLAGIIWSAPADIPTPEPPLSTPLDYLLYLPLVYYHSIVEVLRYAVSHPALIGEGVTFSVSLLAILFSHEMGHYLACRYYRVNATLPFFIPAPPLFLAGTFGAFIKIKSAIPTRRSLFDIGLAGPLAGFIVAIPIAVLGVLTVGPPVAASENLMYFNDPLLFRLISKLAGIPLDQNSPTNPYYLAAWIGLLVTSLNLMPVGQLDGGHGTFAVFGGRAHKIIGRVAFVIVAVLAVLGYWLHGSPSGFLYTVLLAVMMKVPHPQPALMEPLGTKRTVIAIVTLIVFALCFLPFPITIS